jgi:nicotinamidase-related amidase
VSVARLPIRSAIQLGTLGGRAGARPAFFSRLNAIQVRITRVSDRIKTLAVSSWKGIAMNATTRDMRLESRVPKSFQEFLDPPRTALIMWDFQKGLAGRASNAAPMFEAAKELLAAADAAGVFVIWSRHVLPPLEILPGPWLLWLMKKQGVDRIAKLKPAFQAGSEETEFLPGFEPSPGHLVIEKSQPSLFIDTPLDNRLKVVGVRTVVIAGFATDIGVEFTARHASAAGYFSVIAEDATGSHTREAHERSLIFLRNWVQVAKTAKITEAWLRANAS